MRTIAFLLLLCAPLLAQDDALRLNQIQLIGTHNSYHIAPTEKQLAALAKLKKQWRDALDYTHRPLTEQLEKLGVRHFELDIFADPEGGQFAKPMAMHLLPAEEIKAFVAKEHRDKMKKPGFKVLHVADFDFRTTVDTLVDALEEIKAWSDAHGEHVPVMIMLEMKDDRPVPFSRKPLEFDRAMLEAVEAEIRSVFGPDRLITPDAVRGGEKTLRDAVLSRGWPTLAQARGKVLFALDNGGRIRDLYFEGNPALEGRLLFAHPPEEKHPGAAFFKLNDPVRDFDRIQRLAKQGFLIRTRADSETREARANDTSRRDKALASGAQFISTDYPEPIDGVSDYAVRFGGDRPYRQNPVPK